MRIVTPLAPAVIVPRRSLDAVTLVDLSPCPDFFARLDRPHPSSPQFSPVHHRLACIVARAVRGIP
jgi:hypothetical protein